LKKCQRGEATDAARSTDRPKFATRVNNNFIYEGLIFLKFHGYPRLAAATTRAGGALSKRLRVGKILVKLLIFLREYRIF